MHKLQFFKHVLYWQKIFTMKYLTAVISILILASCVNYGPSAESTATIGHMVCLDLKDDVKEADLEMIKTELQKLAELDETISVSIGKRAETGDDRLLKNYDFVLYETFASLEEMKSYATHPKHLAVRKNIKDFLAAAPVVIDFHLK